MSLYAAVKGLVPESVQRFTRPMQSWQPGVTPFSTWPVVLGMSVLYLVVVLGGIGLSGGRGGVLNVVIGTLLIGTMLNGMTIMDISYAGQNLVKGVVLLLAVITDSFLNPRNEETAQQGDI